jgi:hypothetical protein
MDRQIGYIIIIKNNLSAVRRDNPYHHIESSGFTGAVWPEETETLAGDDGKVDPVDGPESVIVFRQIFGGDDLHGRLLIKIAEKKVRRNRTPCQIAQDEGKHVS